MSQEAICVKKEPIDEEFVSEENVNKSRLEDVEKQAVSVKKPAGQPVCVKEEAISNETEKETSVKQEGPCIEVEVKTEKVFVKEEPRWEGADWERDEEAEQAALYAGHNVKQEMVIGTESLQPSDNAFNQIILTGVERTSKKEIDQNQIETQPSDWKPQSSIITDKICNPVTLEKKKRKVKSKKIKSNQHTVPKQKKYICDYCNKSFTIKGRLVQHLLYHKNSKPFHCDLCHKSFSNYTYVYTHRRIHAGEKPHSCSVCLKRFTTSSYLKLHQRIHTGEKPHSCEVCKKTFRQRSQLAIHTLIHKGETAKRHACKLCPMKFMHRYKLLQHERSHAGPPTRTQPQKLDCSECGMQFSQTFKLADHQKVHAGEKVYKCKICETSFMTRTDLNKHEFTHPELASVNYFSCDVCKKIFRVKANLIRHIRTHLDKKPYPCDVCGRAFTQQTHLKSHKLKHADSNPFSCECNKRFTTKRALMQHKARFNTGEPHVHTCKVCGKEFDRANHLKLHQSTHGSNEKNYVCGKCDKQFARPTALKKHEKSHNNSYVCDVCNKDCKNKFNLNRHLRVHNKNPSQQEQK